MSSLKILLLGPLRIELDSAPIEIKRRKGLALLAYLAVTGEAQLRDKLATMFWSDSSQREARATLRNELWLLKEALGEARLDLGREAVALRRSPDLWLDVEQFQQAVTVSQDPSGQLTPDTFVSLTHAVSLYRDDFLTGFTLPNCPDFDEWQFFQAESLRQTFSATLVRLIQAHSVQGNYETAIPYARRWLALDLLHEAAHRQLMQLYAQTGQQAAALRQYRLCVQTLQEELDISPSPETTTLYERIRTRELSEGVGEQGSRGENPSPAPLLPRTSAQAWGEAPDIGVFYGRQVELAELERWLVTDRCRLAAILGMGGVGKTALAAKLTQSLAKQFEFVIWRSLLNAPSFTEILRGCLQFLSAQQITNLPDSLDERLALLLDQLRQHRCLLVLDNLESILQDGDRAGYYRSGYEEYGQLIRRVGEAKHQSCLMLTSRERPKGFARLEEDITSVRSLQLAGLDAEAGHKILKARSLTGSAEIETTLIERYSGNPLALRLVAETIHELFEDDIAAFLTEETPIFDDIRDVLDQQFARLLTLEREIMIWLAIEREAISTEDLWNNLIAPKSKATFLEALRSLQRRSLVEQSSRGFTLQNVVTEYTTERLTTQVCQEIKTETVDLLISHALMKAQAKEYIRQSQLRLILQPVAERLVTRLGQAKVETKLKRLLATLRTEMPLQPSYAGGNILNLLLHLKCDLRGYDFSQLTIWQAYLRGVTLPEVSFAGADLSRSIFTDTFGFIYSVAFSPGGQLLAAGTEAGEIRLWQVLLVSQLVFSKDTPVTFGPSPSVQMERPWPVVVLIRPCACGMFILENASIPCMDILIMSCQLPSVQMERSWPVAVLIRPCACGMFIPDIASIPCTDILIMSCQLPSVQMERLWPVAVVIKLYACGMFILENV